MATVRPVYAGDITQRSLTLQAGTDGGSAPGGEVNHFFQFTVPTTATEIASIEFLYCTTASGNCTTPTGLDTTGASLGSESGLTGWTLDATVNGAPFLTRAAAAAPSSGTIGYQLQDIINPTEENTTFYVRISTYVADDTSGSPIDEGTVAASTATQIELSGIMPESLVFCTGGTISTTNSIPDCSTSTSGNISFNQLFSPADTATATSQMSASTNASGGYIITVNGSTLSSGSNTITPIGSAGPSAIGTGQFGMNLKANTTSTSDPEIGAEVSPASNGTDLRAAAAAGYATVDNFKFTSGDVIAASNNGGAGPTNAQIYTISYIVNVPGSQPAGVYTTTLTYVCTATY